MNSIYKAFLVSIFFVIYATSPVYACGWCTDELVLFIFPSIIFGLPLYILWLVVLTIARLIYKQDASDNSYTACPKKSTIRWGWLLIPAWFGLALMSAGSITIPTLAICVVWVYYLLKQTIEWTKVKDPNKKGRLFIWFYKATMAVLFVIGVGIFIYSRTSQGLVSYFKWDVGPVQALFTDNEVIKLLEHKDAGVRSSALRELTWHRRLDSRKDEMRKYTGNIAKLLNDSDVYVRLHALEALEQLEAKEYIGEITKLFNDKDERVRNSALNTADRLKSVK